ncbi:hypothetical protein EJ110_NYTH57436 [Nymphaea thermarum]|nr:hypothetical protein EJ110_NYTH57436 [Nymphaea thermarum]
MVEAWHDCGRLGSVGTLEVAAEGFQQPRLLISISDVCESPSCKNQWWKEKRVRRSASTFGRLTPALERWKHGGVKNLEIIANDHGNRTAPSYVAMNPTNAIVGEIQRYARGN